MVRHVRRSELLIGIEGLALLRSMYDGSDREAAARLDEVRALLDDGDGDSGEAIPEAEPSAGYAAWSGSYDEPGNPIVELEQPVVWGLLQALPAGRALDAACGTGRHARRLQQLGHEVDGFDLTPEMLALARADAPGLRLCEGDLLAIPFEDERYDVVVCGLALGHVARLRDAVAELARVLAPGGSLIASALHPLLAQLGWQSPFQGPDGRRGFLREHPHTHGDYLAALRGAGLQLQQLHEPPLAAEHVAAKRRAMSAIPEATVAAYAGLPGVLVLTAVKR